MSCETNEQNSSRRCCQFSPHIPVCVLGKTVWSKGFSASLDHCDAVTRYSTHMHVHHWANELVNDLRLISYPIYCLKEFIFDIPLSASYPSQRLSLSPFPLQGVTALHRCFSSSCYRFATRLARINKSAIGAKQV